METDVVILCGIDGKLPAAAPQTCTSAQRGRVTLQVIRQKGIEI
jgi:hypothetical protein